MSSPNFSKKTHQHRVHWTSRVQVEAEATKQVSEGSGRSVAQSSLFYGLGAVAPSNRLASFFSASPANIQAPGPPSPGETSGLSVTVANPLFRGLGVPASFLTGGKTSLAEQLLEASTYRTVLTHKGVDVYEVLWSVDVTTALRLRKPSIDDIVHVEAVWELVS